MTLCTLFFAMILALAISFIAYCSFSFLWPTRHTFPKPPLPIAYWNVKLFLFIYATLSFLGAVILQMGADSISKLMQQKMGKDRWNVEEESFDQNQELIKSERRTACSLQHDQRSLLAILHWSKT